MIIKVKRSTGLMDCRNDNDNYLEFNNIYLRDIRIDTIRINEWFINGKLLGFKIIFDLSNKTSAETDGFDPSVLTDYDITYDDIMYTIYNYDESDPLDLTDPDSFFELVKKDKDNKGKNPVGFYVNSNNTSKNYNNPIGFKVDNKE